MSLPSLAAAQPSWEALAAQVRGCTACAELASTRTQVVPGVHPTGARLLLVGEAPGAQEDVAGLPFVGRAGQLLDELLAQAGLDRSAVAVANVLKCRPPGNRKPSRTEVATCRPWLVRQLELADPAVVVTLGGTAAEWALGPGTRLGAARGRVHRFGSWPLVVTYHPSAALRFGPRGAPRAALLTDLVAVAALLAEPVVRLDPVLVTGTVELVVADGPAMQRLGVALAALLRAGDLVLVSGPLGAGKTTLTQGLGRGLDVRGPVTSPTFVISRVHPSLGDGPALVHVDAYRIGDALEVDDLDLDASLQDAVTVVEWGDGKVEGLSQDRLQVRIERPAADSDPAPRLVRVHGTGPRWDLVELSVLSGLA